MAEKEYIERGALVQYAKEYAPAFSAVFEIIALSVPASDVAEVRHGEWINTVTGYVCSVCHEHEPTKRFLYCPNCGAKMDGGAK